MRVDEAVDMAAIGFVGCEQRLALSCQCLMANSLTAAPVATKIAMGHSRCSIQRATPPSDVFIMTVSA